MKQLKVLTKFQENLSSCFFISCLTVSVTVTPSINTPESSNDFIILIISFTSSFKIIKVNHLPVSCSDSSLFTYFSSKLFIAFEVKFSLVKGIAIFASAFFPNLPSQEPKGSLDWIVLGVSLRFGA